MLVFLMSFLLSGSPTFAGSAEELGYDVKCLNALRAHWFNGTNEAMVTTINGKSYAWDGTTIYEGANKSGKVLYNADAFAKASHDHKPTDPAAVAAIRAVLNHRFASFYGALNSSASPGAKTQQIGADCADSTAQSEATLAVKKSISAWVKTAKGMPKSDVSSGAPKPAGVIKD